MRKFKSTWCLLFFVLHSFSSYANGLGFCYNNVEDSTKQHIILKSKHILLDKTGYPDKKQCAPITKRIIVSSTFLTVGIGCEVAGITMFALTTTPRFANKGITYKVGAGFLVFAGAVMVPFFSWSLHGQIKDAKDCYRNLNSSLHFTPALNGFTLAYKF